jgi:MSHA biogenesis protein MshL
VFNTRRWSALAGVCAGAVLLSACGLPPKPRDVSPGHVSTAQPAPPGAAIPEPVSQAPILPPPKPAAPVETYTVVVADVPVRELLFALARDARINVDIHPDIEGSVTINAINQTLPQILERLALQVNLRHELRGDSLVVRPDLPFLKTYRVDYVNMGRETKSTVKVSTQVASGTGASGGNSDSVTTIENASNHQFWETLENSLAAMITEGGGEADGVIISYPETGLVMVRATSRQHEKVQAYLDEVMASAKRQVLIEASIVEVTLSDRYEAGIDWQKLVLDAGLSVATNAPAFATGTNAFTTLFYSNSRSNAAKNDLTVTARLLKQFGDTSVLSSPKLMALNNQTAVIKVVDNRVYFTIDADTTSTQGVVTTTFDTEPHTVPVGLVMNITPQIDDGDAVTLNVRPTISRILGFVNDPNPSLADPMLVGGAITSPVPEIQTREMESVLELRSGQIAVLGGLMQDRVAINTQGTPLLSDIEGFGEFFKFRDNDFTKTELVIFLRATVIRHPSVQTELQAFQQFLPENLPEAKPAPSQLKSLVEE